MSRLFKAEWPLILACCLAVACTSGRDGGTRDAGNDSGSADAGHAGDERPPPPIAGGTLLITRGALRVVAADPDTDRVHIAGIGDFPGCDGCAEAPKLMATVQLDRGEEPGRLAEDAYGRVHVVLRRGGAIATIEVATGELLARRPVCSAPRGIAYDESEALLHVACASGELVSLSPLSGEVSRRIPLDVDLRDVVVVPDGLIVSRFKTAQLLHVDHDGNVIARMAPKGIQRATIDGSDANPDPLEPAVAWRMVPVQGGVAMLHQYGLARPIDVSAGGFATSPPYAARANARCGGIVAQAVSSYVPGGQLEMGFPLPVTALSVDVSVSTDGQWLAVAHAGANKDRVTVYRTEYLPTKGRAVVSCVNDEGRLVVRGQPVALSIVPGSVPAPIATTDWLVVQTRAPASLSFYQGFTAARTTLALDGPETPDEAHALFHVDGGGGIACAQCHPEGGEDGRVWKFLPFGDRRTQAPNVGLEGTEPFHWSGNLADVRALVDEVFVRRMGGTPRPQSTVEHLERWLYSLRPPAPIVDPASAAAVRGKAIFESREVGCTNCHAGAGVAKNTNEDVGVASPETFQIPSLRGVGYRAPFLHNGCAATLRDRFDPSCGGGDRHGTTSGLSPAEIDDLIAYVSSL